MICALTDKNRAKLKKIGFEIGKAPQAGEPRKPFTFVTKCSFEGTDFYTQAYTYIFSNVTIDSMAVDVSLDLKQIMGRQRVSRKWIDNYNASDPELQENPASGKRALQRLKQPA